jgi:phospholipid/cholesterol/gamma-HCH transport system substrate-binding protein
MSMKLETKVGAFFVGTLAVLAFIVMRAEKLEIGGQKNGSEAITRFRQVAGLNPQGAVRVAGVKVGEVRTIKLESGNARVVFSLPKDLELYGDANVSLASIGILGEKYLELDPGHPEKGLLARGAEIPSKTGVSLDNLMETLADIGKDVKGVTYALNQSIGGEVGRQKLDEIVDNIRVLTAEFRAMAQEDRPVINRTLTNVESITADLKTKLPALANQFEQVGKQLNAMLGENRPELKELVQNFNGTAANLRTLTDKINKGEGTVGKLLNDETTIKKINEAVDNVNSMLGGFKNMDLRLDLGAAQWADRHDSRVSLGIDLAPRQDYWYGLELASTPDGKIAESTRTVTTMDPVTGLPTTTIDKTRNVTVDKAFTLSAQFFKRVGPFVASAGIVESRGGGGIEWRGLDDRLRFGLLAYDFTKRDDKPNPRLRIGGSYQFWRNFYLNAGVQDAANKELRTLYFGGGLRWKDEDLKKLLGLAGAAK